MKLIQLTKGKQVKVDDEDEAALSAWSWHCLNGLYAARSEKVGGRKRMVLMHRQILQALKGQYVDHINGDKLDNRRENLRICTNAENIRNQRPIRKRGGSKYKGVKRSGPSWTARIMVQYKGIHLGSFPSEVEAAKAYNAAAIKYFGRFANLNIIEDAA